MTTNGDALMAPLLGCESYMCAVCGPGNEQIQVRSDAKKRIGNNSNIVAQVQDQIFVSCVKIRTTK